MITKEGDTYTAKSNHPRIGTTHSSDLKALRKTLGALVDTLPEDVTISYAASVPEDERPENQVDDDELLAADEPEHAYKTVPGTERLPATDRTEPAEGREDPKATSRFRKQSGVDVIAVGQVTSPPNG